MYYIRVGEKENYHAVLKSPRLASVFHPLAECRKQFDYLSYKGLAD